MSTVSEYWYPGTLGKLLQGHIRTKTVRLFSGQCATASEIIRTKPDEFEVYIDIPGYKMNGSTIPKDILDILVMYALYI